MPLGSLDSTAVVRSFVDVLRHRADAQPGWLACTFFTTLDGDSQSATYAELDEAARGLAVRLLKKAQPGDRALMLLPPGLEFVATLMGCFYAGVIAVPAYPPRRAHAGRPNRDRQFLESVLADCDPRLILTTRDTFSRWSPSDDLLVNRHICHVEELELSDADNWFPPEGIDLAFLQYTSGSTCAPRGVRVGHAQLVHNSLQIQQRFRHDEMSRGVIWLPPYHDMGLIGGILQPIFAGFPVWLTSPQSFLKRPVSWLEAISEFQGTTSGGPNFAYDLCVERVSAEEVARLDLSQWSVAFTGAEPIRAETLRRFAEKFASCGFQPTAYCPCYGLAEATLMVSGGGNPTSPQVLRREQPSHHSSTHQAASEVVSCGAPVDGIELQIVDPEALTPCATDVEGEIWVRGPSVAEGYWGRSAETATLFEGQIAGNKIAGNEAVRYLRTGDLGLLHDGEVYVTGRRKDVIIVGGRNFAAADVEYAAGGSHPYLSPSRCAALSVARAGAERVVVIAEVDREFVSGQRQSNAATKLPREVAMRIRAALSELMELRVDAVQLVAPLSLPKTASGKIQRYLCRERYLTGQLDLIHGDEW